LKKLISEIKSLLRNGTLRFQIDLKGVEPSKVMQFNEANKESLKSFINDIEIENQILKE